MVLILKQQVPFVANLCCLVIPKTKVAPKCYFVTQYYVVQKSKSKERWRNSAPRGKGINYEGTLCVWMALRKLCIENLGSMMTLPPAKSVLIIIQYP